MAYDETTQVWVGVPTMLRTREVTSAALGLSGVAVVGLAGGAIVPVLLGYTLVGCVGFAFLDYFARTRNRLWAWRLTPVVAVLFALLTLGIVRARLFPLSLRMGFITAALVCAAGALFIWRDMARGYAGGFVALAPDGIVAGRLGDAGKLPCIPWSDVDIDRLNIRPRRHWMELSLHGVRIPMSQQDVDVFYGMVEAHLVGFKRRCASQVLSIRDEDVC